MFAHTLTSSKLAEAQSSIELQGRDRTAMDRSAIDIYTTPAGPAPDGITPNLVNPSTLWSSSIAVCTLCLALTLPLVIAHFYTKIRLLRKLYIEDWLLALAEAALIAWCLVMVTVDTHGAHVWDTSIYDAIRLGYVANILIITYSPTFAFAKIAGLLTTRRIFTGTGSRARTFSWTTNPFSRRSRSTVGFGDVFEWTILTLIWFVALFAFILMFIDIFQCSPREKIWLGDLVSGTCFDRNMVILSSAIVNIMSDIAILALPISAIARLQMDVKSKLTIGAFFSVAVLYVSEAIHEGEKIKAHCSQGHRIEHRAPCGKHHVHRHDGPDASIPARRLLGVSLPLSHLLSLLHLSSSRSRLTIVRAPSIAEVAAINLATTFPTMPRLYKHVRASIRSGPFSSRASPPAPLSSYFARRLHANHEKKQMGGGYELKSIDEQPFARADLGGTAASGGDGDITVTTDVQQTAQSVPKAVRQGRARVKGLGQVETRIEGSGPRSDGAGRVLGGVPGYEEMGAAGRGNGFGGAGIDIDRWDKV